MPFFLTFIIIIVYVSCEVYLHMGVVNCGLLHHSIGLELRVLVVLRMLQVKA